MKKLLILIFSLFLLSGQITYAWWWTTNNDNTDSKGYLGTLPDITDTVEEPEIKDLKPLFEYQDGFNNSDMIKPAPVDNPAFVNIIKKKDKKSYYIKDLDEIIVTLEKLQTIIESSENVQKFNAQAYFFKVNVDFLREKYSKKSEGSYNSFKRLMQLNTHVQAVAQLRSQREAYGPYVATSQNANLFSQNGVSIQLDYLLSDIKETLVILKQTQ
jgi:hypothetical protein